MLNLALLNLRAERVLNDPAGQWDLARWFYATPPAVSAARGHYFVRGALAHLGISPANIRRSWDGARNGGDDLDRPTSTVLQHCAMGGATSLCWPARPLEAAGMQGR
jgi:hypothetical protein